MIIAMLAVTSYLGINFGAESLRVNANRFYQKLHYRDLELSSTMLLGEEDLAALLSQEGIADAEGVLVTSGKVEKEDGHQNIEIVSLTERINTAELLEGKMPSSDEECVLEEELLDVLGLSIGDSITVTDAAGGVPAYLKGGTFTVTGSVHHPDHYALENQAPGNRYLLVKPEAFDREALSDGYMKAVIRIEKPEGISYFSRKYKKMAAAVQDSLADFCKQKEAERTDTFLALFDERIEEAETELAEGRKELEKGRTALDENAEKLADGEAELAEGKEQLEDGKKQIADGDLELSDALKQLQDGKKQLDDAWQQISSGRGELVTAKGELDSARQQLENGRAKLKKSAEQLAEAAVELAKTNNEAEYAKAMVRYSLHKTVNENLDPETAGSIRWAEPSYLRADDMNSSSVSCTDFKVAEGCTVDLTQPFDTSVRAALSDMGLNKEDSELVYSAFRQSDYYESSKDGYEESASAAEKWNSAHKQYLQGKAEYEKGLNTYNRSLNQYQEGLRKYNSGVSEYETGVAQYSDKTKEYEEGKTAYEEGLLEIEDAKKKLAEKETEYNDAVKKLAEGKEELAKAENEYADGVKKLQEGEEELASAKEEKETLGTCHFVLLPARGNSSFTHAEDSAENVGKIGMTFAFLFVLLGALVIYATVGRIIGEQRTLVGTQKALGLFSSEVFRKYLAFGASGSALGILLGTAVGYSFVQKMVLISHEQFYFLNLTLVC